MTLSDHPHWHYFGIAQAEVVEKICAITNQDELIIWHSAALPLSHIPMVKETTLICENAKHADICCHLLDGLSANSVPCLLISIGYTPRQLHEMIAQAFERLQPYGYLLIAHANDPLLIWHCLSGYLRRLYKFAMSSHHSLKNIAVAEGLAYIEGIDFGVTHPLFCRQFLQLGTPIKPLSYPLNRQPWGQHWGQYWGQFGISVLQKKIQSATLQGPVKRFQVPRLVVAPQSTKVRST